MANRFILNETSYHGAGAIKEVVTEVKARGLKKGLVVTDKDLINSWVCLNFIIDFVRKSSFI